MSLDKKCPEFEELSSWYDKQSEQDYTEHVNSCDDCQSVIEDLKKIDSGLSNVLSSPIPSEGLKEKILSTSKEESGKEPIRFMSHLLKLVAILTTAFVLNYLVNKQDDITNSDNLAEQKVSTDSKSVPVMSSISNSPDKIESAPISESLKSEMPTKGFQLVGINAQAETQVEHLKDQVKHVWVSEDVNWAVELLSKNLHTLHFSDKHFDNAGSFHVKIQLSQKELIEKVNLLSSKGLSLVSPDLPQPDSTLASKTPDKLVTYEISIIKKQ